MTVQPNAKEHNSIEDNSVSLATLKIEVFKYN